MASKKRPLAVEAEGTESAGKKMRLSDGASTSHNIAVVATESDRSNAGGAEGVYAGKPQLCSHKCKVCSNKGGEESEGEEQHPDIPRRPLSRPRKPRTPFKDTKKKGREMSEENTLYEGEPEPPPENAYQLFVRTHFTDVSHHDPEYREQEAPRYWLMLPDADKAKYRNRFNDMKQKYIKDYDKFLKGLSREQLKDYASKKRILKKGEEDSSDDSDDDDDDDDDKDDNDDDDDGDDDDEEDSKIQGTRF